MQGAYTSGAHHACTPLGQAPKHKVQDVSSWMTGIQEVPLPMAYKLRNIEETEAAKKRLLMSAAAGPSRCARDPDHLHLLPALT